MRLLSNCRKENGFCHRTFHKLYKSTKLTGDELLEFIETQYIKQNKNTRETLAALREKMNDCIINEDEYAAIQLSIGILEMEYFKQTQFEVVQEQLRIKNIEITRLNEKAFEEYHLFFTQFLIYHIQCMETLNLIKQMHQTLSINKDNIQFITNKLNDMKKEDQSWLAQIKSERILE